MKALDLNLASRPFKNNTLLWAGYVLAFILLGAFTAWNIVTWQEHIDKLTDLQDTVQSIEGRIADLDDREGQAEAGIKAYDLEALGIQAEKANEVIEWKAFSWTRLFNEMERVQPYNVRMTSVRPLFRGGDRRSTLKAIEGDERQSIAVAVEGTAKNYDAFWEMQDSLLSDVSFGHIDPERLNKSEQGEIVFQLSFLYFPEAVDELRAAEAGDGADERAETGDTEVAVQPEPEPVVEQPPVEVVEETFQPPGEQQDTAIPDEVQPAVAEQQAEPAAEEPQRPERTRGTRFAKAKRGSKGKRR
jgi:hypothetical protein